MKITKNSLRELIRQSIYELKEGGKGSGPNKGDRKGMDYKDGKPDSIPASVWNNMDADEKEYHTSGQYDKDAERDDTGKDDEPYTDDDENHGGWSEGEITESTTPTYLESWGSKKTTVKEIKKWMKTLEENRYKKTYNSDARRVSWFVNNNLSEDYESMPISMRKKWSKAAYGKERYLAKEFIKSKMSEEKLRESIRNIVKGLITEATSYKGVFDYNPKDPHKAGRSFEDMFDGAEYGYSESWDTYGWNDQNNHDKAVEEYHKEMFKIVDGYVVANKKAQSFWKTKDKIFKKWRKTDGSKSGD